MSREIVRMNPDPRDLRVEPPRLHASDDLVHQLAVLASAASPRPARRRGALVAAATAGVLALGAGGAWATGAIEVPGLPAPGAPTPAPPAGDRPGPVTPDDVTDAPIAPDLPDRSNGADASRPDDRRGPDRPVRERGGAANPDRPGAPGTRGRPADPGAPGPPGQGPPPERGRGSVDEPGRPKPAKPTAPPGQAAKPEAPGKPGPTDGSPKPGKRQSPTGPPGRDKTTPEDETSSKTRADAGRRTGRPGSSGDA